MVPELALVDVQHLDGLTVQEEIGRGGSGRVFSGLMADGTKVAIKELLMAESDDAAGASDPHDSPSSPSSPANSAQIVNITEEKFSKYAEFASEASLMSLLQHPNLVRLYGVTIKPTYSLVMELLEGGNLHQLLSPYTKAVLLEDIATHHLDMLDAISLKAGTKVCIEGSDEDPDNIIIFREGVRAQVAARSLKILRRPLADSELPWAFRFKLALDIARAMKFLQCDCLPPIIHRDLRSPNVNLLRPFSPAELETVADFSSVHCKVTDFGLSRCVEFGMRGLLPTWPWLAPEVIDSDSFYYDERSDIYSFGIVCWELAARGTPFLSDYWTTFQVHGFFQKQLCITAILTESLRPKIPDDTPGVFASLIKACWSASPSDRPSFEEIVLYLEHAILREVSADNPQQLSHLESSSPSFLRRQISTSILGPMSSPILGHLSSPIYGHHLSSPILAAASTSASEMEEAGRLEFENLSSFALPGYVQCLHRSSGDNQVWLGLSTGAIANMLVNDNHSCTLTHLKPLPDNPDRIYAVLDCKAEGLLLGCGNGSLYLVSREKPERLSGSSHGDMIKSMIFVKDHAQIWTADVRGKIDIWETSPLRVVQTVNLSATIFCMCLVDQSVWIGVGGKILILPTEDPTADPQVLPCHGGTSVNAITHTLFQTVYSAGSDATLHVWNTAGKIIRVLSSHDDSKIFCLESIGQYVLSGGFDCRIFVWDALNHVPLTSFEAHRDSVRCLLALPDHGLILSGSRDRSVKLWKPRVSSFGQFADVDA